MQNQLPKRKQIRLTQFDYASDSAYFVTICTYQRQQLFGQITLPDASEPPILLPALNSPDRMILEYLEKLEDKYPALTLDAFVIMPDHIHLILFQNTGAHMGAPLPQIIQWLITQTTNAYIRGVRNGLYLPYQQHLWQRSYYEHIIRSEQDLLDIRQYIQNNPVLRWAKENALCAP